MKTRSLYLTAAATTAMALQAPAAILLSDSFGDGSRTNQSLPASGAWNFAHGNATGTTLTTNGTNQNLLSTATSASNNQVWVNFGATTIAIGETLNVTFSFDVSGGVNGDTLGDGALRLGLFNVGGTVTSDINGGIASSTWNNATGYSAFADVSPSTITNAVSTLRQRTGASNTLWAAAATTSLSATVVGDPTVLTGTTNNLTTDPLRFLASFSLQRTAADTMAITMNITGNGQSQTLTATDTGIVSTFDTFSFFTGTNPARDFALDNVVISLIPEPSSLIALSLTPLLFALRRKR